MIYLFMIMLAISLLVNAQQVSNANQRRVQDVKQRTYRALYRKTLKPEDREGFDRMMDGLPVRTKKEKAT